MAGVKYKKYDKDNESQYENFLKIKDDVRNEIIAKDLIIEFVTDYKDRSGKYLVDFLHNDKRYSKYLVELGLLEYLESWGLCVIITLFVVIIWPNTDIVLF